MKPTLYNLLQQHGATSDFNKIAALIGDNEAIIVNSIQVSSRSDWFSRSGAFWLANVFFFSVKTGIKQQKY